MVQVLSGVGIGFHGGWVVAGRRRRERRFVPLPDTKER
jgi:hypothetical protein